MSSSFERLIRFESEDGKSLYGNLEKETPTREIEGSEVEVLEGDVKGGFKKSGSKAKVQKLLCPLKREELNIILCVGLNYRRHAEECNVSIPRRPLPCKKGLNLFIAPNTGESCNLHEA
jgi:transcription initiation factor TFIIH subunit 2